MQQLYSSLLAAHTSKLAKCVLWQLITGTDTIIKSKAYAGQIVLPEAFALPCFLSGRFMASIAPAGLCSIGVCELRLQSC